MNAQQQAAIATIKAAIQQEAPREVNDDDVRKFAAEQIAEVIEDYTHEDFVNMALFGLTLSAATVESAADFLIGALEIDEGYGGLIEEAVSFGADLEDDGGEL
jgi:hypothetical protein